MPSPDPFDRLEQSGHRAAFQPVPPPPPVSHLAVEAGRRRQRRRTFAGAAVGAVMVIGLPLGIARLAGDDQPDVVTLADEGAALADDAAAQTADDSDSGGDSDEPAPPADDTEGADGADDGDEPGHDHDFPVPPRLFELLEEDELDLRFEFGDLAFAIRTLTGDAATEAADAAAAAADRSEDIDGQTVWVDEQGESSVVSSLVDGTFIEVTGPTAELEKLLDMASKAPFGDFEFFGPGELPEDFELPEEWEFPPGFPFPEDFDPETFEGFELEEFDPEAFGFGDLEKKFEELEKEFEEFEKCFEITIDETGDDTVVEIPECPLPSLEKFFPLPFGPGFGGEFDPETFEGLEFGEGELIFPPFDPDRWSDLEKLEDLDDLEKLFEGLFPELTEEISA